MDLLFKGYIETHGKKAIAPFKNGQNLKTYEQIRRLPEYAGVLADNVILVDVDDMEQAEMLKTILDKKNIRCPIFSTTRGKHFYFCQPADETRVIKSNKVASKCPLTLTFDIKLGSKASYSILSLGGEKRRKETYVAEPPEIPFWLYPTFRQKSDPNFSEFAAGDGRNQALFNYILTLQSAGFTQEECKIIIKIINEFILKEAFSEREIDTILRDESFKKQSFFKGNNFLFPQFAQHIKQNCNIINLDGQAHIYCDGVYIKGGKHIESEMIGEIPHLSKTGRGEVLAYIGLLLNKDGQRQQDYDKIAFANGVFDLKTSTLEPFSPAFIVSNKIAWHYRPDAYYELTDKTLDKLACNVPEARLLLEEIIGYCLYRRNIFGKAFMLLGDKSNGKSTFLATLESLIGEDNKASLDLKELSNRFKTAELYSKLANIGDDIGDEFISDMSIFKKLVTGESVNAERKGQDPFEFHNYAKLIFSANNLPRINDKTGAVLRRLVIVPFNGQFSPTDADYNPRIKTDLACAESMEYLVRLGVAGLSRVLAQNGFTENDVSEQELADYNVINNPALDFFGDIDIEKYLNNPTDELYKKYKEWCLINNYQPESKITFGRRLVKYFPVKIKPVRQENKMVKLIVSI